MRILNDSHKLAEKLSNCSHAIFDNDGVIYPYSEKMISHLWDVLVANVKDFLPHLSKEVIVQLSNRSYREHGFFYEIYINDFGLDRYELHRRHHEAIDHNLIEVDEKLSDTFSAFSLPCSLLTHSNRDWTNRVLHRLAIGQYFPENKIYAWEDIGFASKAKTTFPFSHVLENEGCSPAQAIMIEDSPANLVHPKILGMTTVLIGPKGLSGNHFDHIDFVFPDINAFLATVVNLVPLRTPGYSLHASLSKIVFTP